MRPEKPDILIAEDDTTSRQLLAAALGKWGYEVTAASDGAEAWARLQEPNAPRLAILDWMMPVRDGIEICRMVRERESPGNRYTYIILLTAKGSKKDVVAGMDAGADDYLVKPFDPQELRVRVRAGQRIIDLHHELREAHEEMKLLSMIDPLTGILNRRAILERLEAEMSRARRENGPLGLSILDIDHFKKVNDTHGHLAGDFVLKECARRFRAGLRLYDAFGRIGGEEFLLVLPGTDPITAVAVSERVRRFIGEETIAFNERALTVTASVGTTVYQVTDRVDDALERADQALYIAKERGRDRVASLFPAPLDASLDRSRALPPILQGEQGGW